MWILLQFKEHSSAFFEIYLPLQRPLWINPDDGWTFARDQNWQPVHNVLKSIMEEHFNIHVDDVIEGSTQEAPMGAS